MENSSDASSPLAGLRVFELGIAIAAPNCGQKLASYGADVFKVESLGNLDVVRLLGSAWAKDDPEMSRILSDTSPYLPEMNAGKYSVGIDLKNEEGLKVALRLLAQCDVFLSNISAAAVVRLGLDYEAVKQINPNIIYTQLPGFGSDPELPYYHSLAWGPNQSPLVGLD
ncbi:MAG: CoA transferase, partial [Acidimicrobiales bacterium]